MASFFLFESIHSLNDPSLLKSPNFKEWENSAIERPSREAFPTPLRLVVLSFGCIVEIPGKLKKKIPLENSLISLGYILHIGTFKSPWIDFTELVKVENHYSNPPQSASTGQVIIIGFNF